VLNEKPGLEDYIPAVEGRKIAGIQDWNAWNRFIKQYQIRTHSPSPNRSKVHPVDLCKAIISRDRANNAAAEREDVSDAYVKEWQQRQRVIDREHGRAT
jgi:hypothetical protein